MDAAKPIGDASAPTPKQLVLAALCGSTGMDVAALLKKNKQQVATFKMMTDGTVSSSHPTEFKVIQLRFDISGECDQAQILSAIELSKTRFCAVSAMLSRGAEISYEVFFNEAKIGAGQRHFAFGAANAIN